MAVLHAAERLEAAADGTLGKEIALYPADEPRPLRDARGTVRRAAAAKAATTPAVIRPGARR
jgi:hypothetical protein